MSKEKKTQSTGPLAQNKKAWHDYEFIEKVEAGISLVGTEVKSVRNRQVDLEGAYARLQDDECWLVGCKIAQYDKAGFENHDPLRRRKLLLHRAQIRKIKTKLEQRGFTLVPTRVYVNERGLIKVELALAKGKRQFDKRQKIQDQQVRRDLDRSTKKFR